MGDEQEVAKDITTEAISFENIAAINISNKGAYVLSGDCSPMGNTITVSVGWNFSNPGAYLCQ